MTHELTRYEYVLVRYMHDLASEEFLNIGVVLFAPDHGKVYVRISERVRRATEFFSDVRAAGLRAQARQIQRTVLALDQDLVNSSLLEARPESLEPLIEQLTGSEAYSSFRASAVRYGVTVDPAERLDRLYDEFVGRFERNEDRPRRDEGLISREIDRRLLRTPFRDQIHFAYRLASDTYEHEFHAAWRNGKPQVLEPISFDYASQPRIVDKANLWSGRLLDLSRENDFGFTAVVAPPSDPTFGRAYDQALRVLRRAPKVRAIVPESEADQVFAEISRDIAAQPDQTLP